MRLCCCMRVTWKEQTNNNNSTIERSRKKNLHRSEVYWENELGFYASFCSFYFSLRVLFFSVTALIDGMKNVQFYMFIPSCRIIQMWEREKKKGRKTFEWNTNKVCGIWIEWNGYGSLHVCKHFLSSYQRNWHNNAWPNIIFIRTLRYFVPHRIANEKQHNVTSLVS